MQTKTDNAPHTHRLLVVILVLQALVLLGQWTGGGAVLPAAQAQIPDSGAQRNRIIDELASLNQKADALLKLIDSGKIQVKVAEAKTP